MGLEAHSHVCWVLSYILQWWCYFLAQEKENGNYLSAGKGEYKPLLHR